MLSAAKKPPGVMVIAPNCTCLSLVTNTGTAPSGKGGGEDVTPLEAGSREATERVLSLVRCA